MVQTTVSPAGDVCTDHNYGQADWRLDGSAIKYRSLSRLIEQRIAAIGSLLVIIVILLYLLSQFIPPLNEWIIRGGFLNVVIIVLLVDLLNRAIEAKISPAGLQVFDTQNEALPQLLRHLDDKDSGVAYLIEYSTATIRPLLEKLREKNFSINLLLFDPEFAVSDEQRGSIAHGLSTMRQDFKGYEKLTVKRYRTPASLRGRRIGDDLINVGWYTYDLRDEEVCVRGHNNTMLLADAQTAQGRKLRAMFDRTFDALWRDAEPVAIASAAPMAIPRA